MADWKYTNRKEDPVIPNNTPGARHHRATRRAILAADTARRQRAQGYPELAKITDHGAAGAVAALPRYVARVRAAA